MSNETQKKNLKTSEEDLRQITISRGKDYIVVFQNPDNQIIIPEDIARPVIGKMYTELSYLGIDMQQIGLLTPEDIGRQDLICQRCGRIAISELILHRNKVFDEFLCLECLKALVNNQSLPEPKGIFITEEEASTLNQLYSDLLDLRFVFGNLENLISRIREMV